MATIKQIGQWIYDHRATLMSWGATLGTIGGSVLTARAVPKAQSRILDAKLNKINTAVDEAEKRGASDAEIEALFTDKRFELTLLEKIKAGGPAFIPAILAEAATIGCIHGSDHSNKKEIARGKEALAVAVAGFAAYQESVGVISDRTTQFAAAKRLEMMEQSKQNGDPPWDETQHFTIYGQPGYFDRTMEEVFEAEYLANRTFALKGDLPLNELYQLFGLPAVHDELVYENDGDCMGWDSYIGEVYYGYTWIDFEHIRKAMPDGTMVTEIRLSFPPHPLDEDVVDDAVDRQIAEINGQILDSRAADRFVEQNSHG